jgi:hypothetical protein
MCKLCAEPDEIKIKVRDSEAEYWRQAARAEGGEDHAEYYGYE